MYVLHCKASLEYYMEYRGCSSVATLCTAFWTIIFLHSVHGSLKKKNGLGFYPCIPLRRVLAPDCQNHEIF